MVGLVIYIVSPFLLNFFDEKNIYISSTKLIGILIIGIIFDGYYRIASFGIFLKKKTYLLPIITLASAVFNILICYLLVFQIGIAGAAIAMTLSFFLKFVLSYWQSIKLYPTNLFKGFLLGGAVVLVLIFDIIANNFM